MKKHSHIAIFNIPKPVHIHPTLSVVSTLVRRGHRVTYVSSKTYATEILGLGGIPLCCPELGSKPENADGTDLDFSPDLAELARATLSVARPFYDQNPPDLIVYDTLAYGGLILADHLRVPSIRITSHLADDEENPTYRKHYESFKKVDTLLQGYGFRGDDDIFLRSDPVIYFYPQELQVAYASDDRQSIYAARCAAERPISTAINRTPVDDGLVALVSASTAYTQEPKYYKTCMRALSDLGWSTILAIGNNNDPKSFDPLPDCCEIVQGIPQMTIMPYVDLLICTGGMATTMEAMYHGVPLLMLTHGYAQMERYADNSQSHGLGIHLSGTEIGRSDLKKSIIKARESPIVHSKVRRMQRVVRESAGGEDVANYIEQFLR